MKQSSQSTASTKTTRSVDSLQKIYAVIIALAIGRVLTIVFEGDTWQEVTLNFKTYLPELLSFFLLIVPFYHGMNRHLDNCYVEKQDTTVQGALLIDFFVFCIEAALLFIFANFVKLGLDSFKFLAILLILDVAWGLGSHFIHYRKLKPSVIWWSVINTVALIIGFVIYALDNVFTNIEKEYIFLIIMLIRTVFDYITSWRFYFPKD